MVFESNLAHIAMVYCGDAKPRGRGVPCGLHSVGLGNRFGYHAVMEHVETVSC
jgi:hypothetical protein